MAKREDVAREEKEAAIMRALELGYSLGEVGAAAGIPKTTMKRRYSSP